MFIVMTMCMVSLRLFVIVGCAMGGTMIVAMALAMSPVMGDGGLVVVCLGEIIHRRLNI